MDDESLAFSQQTTDIENPNISRPSTSTVNNNNNGPVALSQVEDLRAQYGFNTVFTAKRLPTTVIFLRVIFHPFNMVLCFIAICSGVLLEFSTGIIMSLTAVLSIVINFYNEWQSKGQVQSLLPLLAKSVTVIRFDDNVEYKSKEVLIPGNELVPGDWVVLHPGDLVPADAVVLSSKVFSVCQKPLSENATPVEKFYDYDDQVDTKFDYVADKSEEEREDQALHHKLMAKWKRWFRTALGIGVHGNLYMDKAGFGLRLELECHDKVFMGSQVITGIATVCVLRTGPSTLFGKMAEALTMEQPINPFQQGDRQISWMLLSMLQIMLPAVYLAQGLIFGEWSQGFVFAVSLSVALVPEMLSLMINANLRKGWMKMTRKKSIVKTWDSVANIGAIDVLCIDKTGTLTRSVMRVSAHVNPYGESSFIPIQIAFLNSYFQSVLQNPLDSVITAYFEKLAGPGDPAVLTNRPKNVGSGDQREINAKDIDEFLKRFGRLDELPFDFVRRRLSILLIEGESKEETAKVYLVCKGAAEETLAVCSKVVTRNTTVKFLVDVFPPPENIIPLDSSLKAKLREDFNGYMKEGQRVLAIAYKPLPPGRTAAVYEDEFDMILVGFVYFYDPPKADAMNGIEELLRHNIEVKVLTGDSPQICSYICEKVQLPIKSTVTGDIIDIAVENGTLAETVEQATVFAELTPLHKSLVVRALRKENSHVVAFMGDGVNDAPSLKEANVGICVHYGVDICRESAEVILLEKDLNAVVSAVRIGRETYGNTIKYIALAISSNFGNAIAVLLASVWFNFEPMLGFHLLILDFLYNLAQIAVPFDSVDEDILIRPHKWRTKSILRFMLLMGSLPVIFDIATFAYLVQYKNVQSKDDKDGVKLFHTTWFTVGLLTQTLIVLVTRTPKFPIIQSSPSLALFLATIFVVALGLGLPYIPIVNDFFEFTHGLPEDIYYQLLLPVLAAYFIIASIVKIIYLKIWKDWF